MKLKLLFTLKYLPFSLLLLFFIFCYFHYFLFLAIFIIFYSLPFPLLLSREAHNLSMNITVIPCPFHNQYNFTVVIGDRRRKRNMQNHSTSRKKDLIIVQGAAFRIRKHDNNTYSVRAAGTSFEDVVILVKNFLIKITCSLNSYIIFNNLLIF